MHVAAEQRHRSPGAPPTRAHMTVGFGDSPRRRHQQAECQVRGGLGQHAGRVPDGDTGAGGGVEVDIVHADGQVADDAQLRRLRNHARVDLVGHHREHRVGVLQRGAQHRLRRRQLVAPYRNRGRGAQALDRGGIDRAGDEYFSAGRSGMRRSSPDGSNSPWALLYATSVADSIISSVISSARSSGRTVLTEIESKRILHSLGLPVVVPDAAATADDAVRAASRIGFPVVLKVLSPDVSHKSDVGGVELNVGDEAAVRDAFERIRKSLAAKAPQCAVRRRRRAADGESGRRADCRDVSRRSLRRDGDGGARRSVGRGDEGHCAGDCTDWRARGGCDARAAARRADSARRPRPGRSRHRRDRFDSGDRFGNRGGASGDRRDGSQSGGRLRRRSRDPRRANRAHRRVASRGAAGPKSRGAAQESRARVQPARRGRHR